LKNSRESSAESFENDLMNRFGNISFDHEVRQIAEQLRDQARQNIKDDGDICDKKQQLIRSVKVVPGARKGEYLVVSEGEYGKDLEFGTRNSLEKPWFTPAFVTVAGSIHKCLHGALKRALQKTRRLPVRR